MEDFLVKKGLVNWYPKYIYKKFEYDQKTRRKIFLKIFTKLVIDFLKFLVVQKKIAR